MVEVIVAAAILAVGLATSAICLQMGLRNLDTAQKMSMVTQALQDEAERLRLSNWALIGELPDSAEIQGSLPAKFSGTPLAEMIADGTCVITRTVSDVDDFEDMKQITLTGTWVGIDGRERSRMIHLRYARGGTNDYYYGTRDD